MGGDPIGARSEIAAALVLGAVATTLCFFPHWRMFFVFDDLPTLRISVAALGNGLGDAFTPMSNGFWRPLHRLLIMGVTGIFGMSVVPLQTLGFLLHVMNGALLFVLARRAVVLTFRWALVASLIFQVSPAGTLAIVQPGNFADLLALTGILTTLCAHLLVANRVLGGLLFAIGLVIGFAAKEIFVVMPALLVAVQRGGWKCAGGGAFRSRFFVSAGLSLLYVAVLLVFISRT
jgi:hypothetical protein